MKAERESREQSQSSKTRRSELLTILAEIRVRSDGLRVRLRKRETRLESQGGGQTIWRGINVGDAAYKRDRENSLKQ